MMASNRPNPLPDAPGDVLMQIINGVNSLELPDPPTSNSPPSARDPLEGFSVDSPLVPGQKSIFGPQFSLMQLPKELRKMVYTEHFGHVVFQANRSFRGAKVFNGRTGILRACKHVYAEARKVLFRNREVEFHDLKDMTKFCKEIGQHNFNLIRHVKIVALASEAFWGWQESTQFLPMLDKLANSAPGLRHLTLIGPAILKSAGFDISYLPVDLSTQVLEALARVKQLRRLQLTAKLGNAMVAQFAAAVGPDVEIKLA